MVDLLNFSFITYVLQILLDVVSVFNMVSSLSQKKQSIKINQEGIEVTPCLISEIILFAILS